MAKGRRRLAQKADGTREYRRWEGKAVDDMQVDRINELARKAKEQGLSQAEKEEQDMLRKAYVQAVRENFKNTMNTITIEYPDGTRKKPLPKDLT